MILGESSQAYEMMEGTHCKTNNEKPIKDINQAKEACNKMLDCIGIANAKCKGKDFKLCRSSKFQQPQNSNSHPNCVLRKVLGKSVKLVQYPKMEI